MSNVQSYTLRTNLLNGHAYTIKLRVRNDKGLWSAEASKTIRISFAALSKAKLGLSVGSDGGVIVNVDNPVSLDFRTCEVYRKSVYDRDWARIARNVADKEVFVDTLVASNTMYEYKVISYNKTAGATESDVFRIVTGASGLVFIDLDTMQSIGRCLAPDVEYPFTRRRVRDKNVLKFEGMKAPVLEVGESDYSIFDFELSFKNYNDFRRFESSAEKAKVLLFKSPQGHLVFGQVSEWGEESIDALGYVKIKFQFIEVAFIHSEIFIGGKTLRVIRVDRGYKLDAGYVIDGVYYD